MKKRVNKKAQINKTKKKKINHLVNTKVGKGCKDVGVIRGGDTMLFT